MKNTLFLLIVFFSTRISAQKINLNFPITDAPVNTMCRVGDTLYIGGEFTHIYSPDSSGRYGVPVNKHTGIAIPKWPKVMGAVNASLPDGHGGFYIGGDFIQVGDSLRHKFAHIDSSGKVTNFKWNVNYLFQDNYVSDPTSVYTIDKWGDTLFIGGRFSHVGSSIIKGSGFRVGSDGLPAYYDMPYVNGIINCVVSDGDGGWYIGGNFTQVGDHKRNRLAHIDSTGYVYPWNPDVSDTVFALFLRDNNLYIGGSFSSINNIARSRIALLDAYTGEVKGWAPRMRETVYYITASDSTVYLAGNFFSVNDTLRKYVAAVNMYSGFLTKWNPNPNAIVNSMCVIDNTVYIGGSFYTVNDPNTRRNGLAAVDAYTGNLLSWDANLASRSTVYAIASSNNTLYIGGNFNSVAGKTRNNLAAIDLSTATLKNWNASVNGAVTNFKLRDTLLYAGGDFSQAGSDHIATISTITGKIYPGNAFGVVGSVKSLDISGKSIYAGGTFKFVGGTPRRGIVAVRISTNEILPWDLGLNNDIYRLSVSNNTLFTGGEFTKVGATGRKYLASFNLKTGTLNNWNPNPDNYVYRLSVIGNTVYTFGYFTTIGGQTRYQLAGVDILTGNATPWVPYSHPLNGSTIVDAIVGTASKIYVAGRFDSIAGQPRSRLAAFDYSGNLLSWKPNVNDKIYNTPGLSEVRDLLLLDDTLYICGDFFQVNGQTRNSLAAFDTSGNLTSWNPNANGTALSLSGWKDRIFLGGWFSGIGGTPRNHLASIDLTTGNLTDWNPNIHGGNVYSLASFDTDIYAGGSFDSVNSFQRKGLVSINGKTGDINSWYPLGSSGLGSINPIAVSEKYVCIVGSKLNQSDELRVYDRISGNLSFSKYISDVQCLSISGGKLYIGGKFSSLWSQTSTVTRNNLSAIELGTGKVTAWNPNSDGIVNILQLKDSVIYAIGKFSSMGGKPRDGIAAVDTSLGYTLAWSSASLIGRNKANFSIMSNHLSGNILYAGTSDAGYPYLSENSIWAFDTESNKVKDWFVSVDKTNTTTGTGKEVRVVNSKEDAAYAGGNFVSANGYKSDYLVAFSANNFSCSISNIPSKVCPGSSFDLSYNTSVSLSANNVFTVQLSNASGGFTAPLNVGTLISNQKQGTISCLIPLNVLSGGHYRIRVVTNKSGSISEDNGSDISIGTNIGVLVNKINQCLTGNHFTFTDITPDIAGRLWIFEDNSTDTVKFVNKSYANSGIHHIKLIVSSENGCKDSIEQIVNVEPALNPGITINKVNQCLSGNQFVFTDTTFGAITRLWDFGDGTTDMKAMVTKSYTTSGTYPIKLQVSNNGCKDSVLEWVNVYSSPSIGHLSGLTSVVSADTASYSVLPQSGLNYNWSIVNGIINMGQGSNSVNVEWLNSGSGKIALTVKSSEDCYDSTFLNVTIGSTGLDNISISSFQVYPNPASKEIIIMSNRNSMKGYQIEITDILGKNVLTENISKDTYECPIIIESLEKGTYIINISFGKDNTLGRFKWLKI